MSAPLVRGAVVWVDLDPTRGREQRGTRPAVVVCGADYLSSVPDLVIVVPITTVDRGWPHHVPIDAEAGLSQRSFAMTEQPRTISRERIARAAGVADEVTMAEVDQWVRDFMDL